MGICWAVKLSGWEIAGRMKSLGMEKSWDGKSLGGKVLECETPLGLANEDWDGKGSWGWKLMALGSLLG